MDADVRFTGMKEIRAKLKGVDKEVKKGIRLKLKNVGEIVAVEARSIYSSNFRTRTGRALKSIKPRASLSRVAVVASAKTRSKKYPQGFNYPKRQELWHGRKPFMKPALERKQTEVVDEFGEILTEVGRIWSK